MTASSEAQFIELFGNWEWRLDNLYYITTKEGARRKFVMNWAQRQLFRNMHYLNIILKARQLGFSTFIQIFMLDAALFNPNTHCGVIAQTRDAASGIFQRNVKFAYDNLPDEIRDAIPAKTDRAQMLQFGNGSSIEVGTSLRGGTFQYLHISEFGKICATRPDRAREIVTGALNTLAAGQIAFIESTAEGRDGAFCQMCDVAQEHARRGLPLTALDYKFHFFPWWKEPSYAIDADVVVTGRMREYFDKLRSEHGIHLTREQEAWYVKKESTQEEDMKREYPSTPEEAFEASVEGAYYAKQFHKVDEDGRIRSLSPVDGIPTHTRWDLGMNDEMCIWWFQIVGSYTHFIDFYQNSGEGLGHYAQILQERQRERGLVYGTHLWPHDGNVRILDEKGRSRRQVMANLGYAVTVVERNPSLPAGIDKVRQELGTSVFDEERCADGIRALRGYKKAWDEKNGAWLNRPVHNADSNPADAFRTGSEGRDHIRDISKPMSTRTWDQIYEDALL